MNKTEKVEAITSDFAEWFDESKIKKPDYKLKRLDDKRGSRFYYETNPFATRAGITSLLKKVLPPSFAITEWQKKYGDKADYMLDISSRFGTAMHVINKDWVVNKTVNEAEMQKSIGYCKEYGASEDTPYKDLVSFMKFCEDYSIRPLLCEAMLRAEFNGDWYALTLDLLCEVTIAIKEDAVVETGEVYKTGAKSGQAKTKNVVNTTYVKKLALVDFKSNFFQKSDKAFYESHLLQLIAAKEAVKQNFGLEVDILINYSPNAWRTEPSYSQKVWEVKDKDVALFNNLMEQARLRGYFTPTGTVFMPLPVGGETKSNEAYTFYNYEQYALYLESQMEVLFNEETA